MTDELNGFELLLLWQTSELSQRALAEALGLDFDALHGQIYRAQKKLGLVDEPSGIHEDKFDAKVSGNTKDVTARSRRIKTLDDLIEACDIDLDQWQVLRHEVNKWEVGAKVAEKVLTWKNGQIEEGHLHAPGRLTIEPLFQVKATLVKRHPEPLHPILTPTEISVSKVRRSKARKTHGFYRDLQIADPHFGFSRDLRTGELTPYHDRRALSVILSLVDHTDFKNIRIAGDFLDMAEWSDKFIKSPEMFMTTKPALVEATWFLGQLIARANQDTQIHLITGNHDERLRKKLLKHAWWAYDLRPGTVIDGPAVLSIPHLLDLDRLGVHYEDRYPDGEMWINDHGKIIHGLKVRAKPGATAAAVLQEAVVSTGFGHVHRLEKAAASRRDRFGKYTVWAWCSGCLCRIDGTVPGSSQNCDWQQGAAVIDYDDRKLTPHLVPIDEQGAFFEGQHYEPWDYLEDLRRDTGWDF
jgi:hypothetical protein